MVRPLELMFILLFLVGSVWAVDYDSTRQVRVVAYNLIGFDTTGTDNVPTKEMDRYVNLSLQKVNEDLQGYKRRDMIATVIGQRFYEVDSVVQVLQVNYASNDSLYGLIYVPFERIDSIYEAANFTSEDKPYYYSTWVDSLLLIPSPVLADDTLMVAYIHVIPSDSLRLLPFRFREGLIYYSAWLSAKDAGLANAKDYFDMYQAFLAQKRGDAVE